MLKSFLHRFTAGALILVLPMALVSADAGTAMLTAGQKVTVNGVKVQGRQAIRSGDVVRNDDEASALLAMPGASVLIGAHSSVVHEKDSIRITAGAANLRTQSAMPAYFDELTVRPADSKAQFVVGEVGGKRLVAAIQGSVIVSDGTYEVLLPEGNAMTQDSRPTPPLRGKDVKGDTKKPEKERRGGKRIGGFALPGWSETLIIGGTIAGVFIGLYAAGFFDKEASPSSPIQP